MNPKFIIKPKSSPSINKALLGDSVDSCLESILGTDLFYTSHGCLSYKSITGKWSQL